MASNTRRAMALLHLEHEGLGLLRPILEAQGWAIAETNLWKGDALPRLGDFDMLIPMGGAMNADEDGRYPWLGPEKRLIAEAIGKGKRVLGICLGAQLIARALGAPVQPMGYKEIGWFPITYRADRIDLFPTLRPGDGFGVAHWHGDTFDLPPDCDHLFASEACAQQGFALKGAPVVGLQFHLELDAPMLDSFIAHSQEELAEPGPWVQPQADYRALHGAGSDRTQDLLWGLAEELGNARPCG